MAKSYHYVLSTCLRTSVDAREQLSSTVFKERFENLVKKYLKGFKPGSFDIHIEEADEEYE